MREVINLIQSVGFPIFIALLFYIDLRQVVNRNTEAISSLTQQQGQLIKVLRSQRS